MDILMLFVVGEIVAELTMLGVRLVYYRRIANVFGVPLEDVFQFQEQR